MKIRNVLHKGLRRFIEEDDASGVPAAVIPKLRKIVSFLQDMEQEGELRTVANWSLFLTKNWRLTFRIDQTAVEIFDLDYEDYH